MLPLLLGACGFRGQAAAGGDATASADATDRDDAPAPPSDADPIVVNVVIVGWREHRRVGACLDRAMGTTGIGTAMSVGPLLTTHAHDLLVASTFQLNQASAGDPGYTSRGINNFGDLVEDLEVNATGNYTALATQNSAGAWVMQLAAFEGM